MITTNFKPTRMSNNISNCGDMSKSLTHWGRVTHICVSKLSITGSDNGLSPGRRQAIIWTNAGILLIEPLGTKFSEILIEIRTFSFNKMHLKMASGNWRPFCLGLNVLKHQNSNSIMYTIRHAPFLGCDNGIHLKYGILSSICHITEGRLHE